MSLWAPGAVFNIDQQTLTGKAQIRHWFADREQGVQAREPLGVRHAVVQDPDDLNGDKATLYFECHYIDPKTGKVVAYVGVDHTLQKINGKWLIVELGRVDRDAEPVVEATMASPRWLEAPPARRRWAALGRIKDRLVRGGRARCRRSVRTKLLVAFLGIAALLVLVSVARPARARPVERARRAARHAAAPLGAVPGARGATPTTCSRCSACAPAAQPGLTPYTGGPTLEGGRAVDARRPDDRRVHALAGRARRRRADASASSRRPPTSACCDGSGSTTRRSTRR